MKDFILRSSNKHQSQLTVNSRTAKSLEIQYIAETRIRFGYKVKEVSLRIDENIPDFEIRLSEKIIERLKLPKECAYQLAVNASELILGPFIGIYMGEKEASVIRKIAIADNYIKNYSDINGVIFAFSLENMNKERMTVKGFFYNPEKRIWERATLPYPAMIFRKQEMTKSIREYFSKIYGDKLFNYKTVGKWDMHQRLVRFPEIEPVLPPTIDYKEKEELFRFLEEHRDIYIKPIEGRQGAGIFNVVKKMNAIQVTARVDDQDTTWSYSGAEDFSVFIEENFTPGAYIIQKTLDSRVNNRITDFRVGLDRDQTGEWQNIMFVARVGAETGIVSNRVSGGDVYDPMTVLKEFYQLDEQKALFYKKKLVDTAKLIADKLEKTGLHFGKLAFDLSLDKNYDVWLIELNNKKPDDNLAQYIGDKDTAGRIRLTNMLYAKRLAGFPENTANGKVSFPENLNSKTKMQTKRYRLYAAVTPYEESGEYLTNVQKIAEELNLTGNAHINDKQKKVQIEIEGRLELLNTFIEQLHIKKEKINTRLITKQILKPLKTETNFTSEDSRTESYQENKL